MSFIMVESREGVSTGWELLELMNREQEVRELTLMESTATPRTPINLSPPIQPWAFSSVQWGKTMDWKSEEKNKRAPHLVLILVSWGGGGGIGNRDTALGTLRKLNTGFSGQADSITPRFCKMTRGLDPSTLSWGCYCSCSYFCLTGLRSKPGQTHTHTHKTHTHTHICFEKDTFENTCMCEKHSWYHSLYWMVHASFWRPLLTKQCNFSLLNWFMPA